MNYSGVKNAERNVEGVEEYALEQDEKHSDKDLSTKSVQDKWLSELIAAIKDDDTQKMGELFRDREDVDVRFDYQFPDVSEETKGLTPLALAAALGKSNIVRELLNRDVDISAKATSDGETPFLMAAKFGNLDVLKILFKSKKGGSHLLEERSECGKTALLVATMSNHENVVEFLLDNEANITAIDCSRQTALHIVCKTGNEKIFQLLLKKLSSTDSDFSALKAILHLKDDWSRTPLTRAACSRNSSVFLQCLSAIQMM